MRRRMVNMPGAFGSPSSTAIFVPFGMVGGPSFQTRFATLIWIASGGDATARARSATATARNLVRIGRTVHQKPLAPLGELAQLVFPLCDPLVDVPGALDHLAITRAAGEKIDGQPVGDELVLLASPVELLRT